MHSRRRRPPRDRPRRFPATLRHAAFAAALAGAVLGRMAGVDAVRKEAHALPCETEMLAVQGQLRHRARVGRIPFATARQLEPILRAAELAIHDDDCMSALALYTAAQAQIDGTLDPPLSI